MIDKSELELRNKFQHPRFVEVHGSDTDRNMFLIAAHLLDGLRLHEGKINVSDGESDNDRYSIHNSFEGHRNGKKVCGILSETFTPVFCEEMDERNILYKSYLYLTSGKAVLHGLSEMHYVEPEGDPDAEVLKDFYEKVKEIMFSGDYTIERHP